MTVRVPDETRWVLFDAVGTLIYAEPPMTDVYESVGRRFGSRLDAQQIALHFRQALAAELGTANDLCRPPTSEANELARWRRIVAAVFLDVLPPAAECLFDSLWRHFAMPTNWRLFFDVELTLRRLQQRGIRLGIASNFDGRLREIAARLPELAGCENVFVSSQVGFSKPDPRFFAAVAVQLALPPSQILLVGDDWLADVQGARAAGWQAVFLNRQTGADTARSAISSLLELDNC